MWYIATTGAVTARFAALIDLPTSVVQNASVALMPAVESGSTPASSPLIASAIALAELVISPRSAPAGPNRCDRCRLNCHRANWPYWAYGSHGCRIDSYRPNRGNGGYRSYRPNGSNAINSAIDQDRKLYSVDY